MDPCLDGRSSPLLSLLQTPKLPFPLDWLLLEPDESQRIPIENDENGNERMNQPEENEGMIFRPDENENTIFRGDESGRMVFQHDEIEEMVYDNYEHERILIQPDVNDGIVFQHDESRSMLFESNENYRMLIQPDENEGIIFQRDESGRMFENNVSKKMMGQPDENQVMVIQRDESFALEFQCDESEGLLYKADEIEAMLPDDLVQYVDKPEETDPKKAATKAGTIAVLQNIPVHTKINVNKVSSGKSMTVNNKANFQRNAPSAALSTVLTPGKSLLKDKERKSSSQFASQQYSDDKMAGDDDINDVAAMGGVNLAEETQRILGSTEMIGTQIRSCKEEYLVPTSTMQARLKAIAAKYELEEPSADVANLLCHAMHERLKTIVEKLAVIALHRVDLSDDRYEVTHDVKGQLKFLEELDRVDKKRREDSEREILLRAAKSRSKNEDPEQAKLKAKAKEMQRAELEELRQREANLTALQAIGPRKKARLDAPGAAGDSAAASSSPGAGISGRSQMALRTRLKRINQRDMIFLMEQDPEFARSLMLYKSYLK